MTLVFVGGCSVDDGAAANEHIRKDVANVKQKEKGIKENPVKRSVNKCICLEDCLKISEL